MAATFRTKQSSPGSLRAPRFTSAKVHLTGHTNGVRGAIRALCSLMKCQCGQRHLTIATGVIASVILNNAR